MTTSLIDFRSIPRHGRPSSPLVATCALLTGQAPSAFHYPFQVQLSAVLRTEGAHTSPAQVLRARWASRLADRMPEMPRIDIPARQAPRACSLDACGGALLLWRGRLGEIGNLGPRIAHILDREAVHLEEDAWRALPPHLRHPAAAGLEDAARRLELLRAEVGEARHDVLLSQAASAHTMSPCAPRASVLLTVKPARPRSCRVIRATGGASAPASTLRSAPAA
eukprot:6385844-Prymnesium_polylepis.2